MVTGTTPTLKGGTRDRGNTMFRKKKERIIEDKVMDLALDDGFDPDEDWEEADDLPDTDMEPHARDFSGHIEEPPIAIPEPMAAGPAPTAPETPPAALPPDAWQRSYENGLERIENRLVHLERVVAVLERIENRLASLEKVPQQLARLDEHLRGMEGIRPLVEILLSRVPSDLEGLLDGRRKSRSRTERDNEDSTARSDTQIRMFADERLQAGTGKTPKA